MPLVHSITAPLIVFCLVFSACEDQGGSVVNSPLPGTVPSTYSYRAYTSTGVLAVVGTLTMAKTDSTAIAGTWAFQGVSSVDRVGPQVGSGSLVGELTGSRLSIDLNPGWRDNNVILIGSAQGEKIVGTWSWITFAGPTSNGTFEAVKKE